MGSCCMIKGTLSQPKISKLLFTPSISKYARVSNIRQNYQFIKVLGYGQFGTVRQAVRINPHTSQKEVFAIKSILKQRVKRKTKMLKTQLEILRQTDHPNIIKFIEIYQDEKYLHIVMQRCSGGDLLEHIIKRGALSQHQVSLILLKLLSALNYLHNSKICHRDIKPQNFLYKDSENESEIKLIDFGMSAKFDQYQMKSVLGTPYYLAPEVLSGNYGKECDIWSVGVVGYLLLSGKHPFCGNTIQQLLNNIQRANYNFQGEEWRFVSEDAIDLIQNLLTPIPQLRIKIQQAFKHRWFQRASQQTIVNPDIFRGLIRYKSPGKLWQQLMKVIVKYVSYQKIKELQTAFQIIDRNKTGFITVSDIEAAMQNSGFQGINNHIQMIQRNIQYIGQGRINYTQFLVVAIDKKTIFQDETLWAVFKYFDIYDTGEICLQDLKMALERAGCEVSDQDFSQIMCQMQLHAGSKMDFENFKEILCCFSEQNTIPNVTEIDQQQEQWIKAPARRLSVRRLSVRRNTLFEKRSEKEKSTVPGLL